MKLVLASAALMAMCMPAFAGGTGSTISETFKGGPNSAHGQSYGSVNKAINEAIRETGSYTSVHSGVTYTKPGAGNRLSNGKGTRD